ncbi:hypothetical protein E1265_34180 [Streptomyces sp. 8K308]|uniref:hypothetical protein n=1 Tax=Streptomyces sp. 8K308 TaxID=2530388 RepID=UPI00104BB3DF|nr:hypothetical protein [Streptomyces sp. 8K308]TDC07249.1 hypothetical protein E1265_34180 [Streptomyces sp. 8K308]
MSGSGATGPRQDRPPPAGPRPSGPTLTAAALCVLGGALSFLAVTLARNAPLTDQAANAHPLRIAQVTSQLLAPSCPAGRPDAFYDPAHSLCRTLDLDGGVTVAEVADAEAVPGPIADLWAVRITFRTEDAAALRSLTARVRFEPYPRGQLAFVHGGRVLSAGVLAGPDAQGTASLGGPYSRAEAEVIAGELAG